MHGTISCIRFPPCLAQEVADPGGYARSSGGDSFILSQPNRPSPSGASSVSQPKGNRSKSAKLMSKLKGLFKRKKSNESLNSDISESKSSLNMTAELRHQQHGRPLPTLGGQPSPYGSSSQIPLNSILGPAAAAVVNIRHDDPLDQRGGSPGRSPGKGIPGMDAGAAKARTPGRSFLDQHLTAAR